MELTEKDKKQLKIAGIALVGGIAVYYLFFNKDNGGAANDPTGNGYVNPETISSFNANKAATDLYNAMKSMGTDKDTIRAVLGKMTQTQFGQVRTAFGNRPYNTVLGNQYEVFGVALDNLPLEKWLFYELGANSDDYKAYRLKFPKYL